MNELLKSNYTVYQIVTCREPELNRYRILFWRILSPLRLPISPSRLVASKGIIGSEPYHYFDTSSQILSNTDGNTIAMFERTFLSKSISFCVICPMNTLYFNHLVLKAALSLSIHNFLKILFFNFLPTYAFCHCLTRADLTCL